MSEWRQGLPEKSGIYWFAHDGARRYIVPCKVLLGEQPDRPFVHTRRLVRMLDGYCRGRDNPVPDDLSIHCDPEHREFSLQDPCITTGHFRPIEQPEPPK